MADVRALLKAKRQEIRVNHPLATYTSSGQLRCVACGTIVKQSSSWEGHVGSKAHRTNAAKLREEEHKRALAAEEAKINGKRKMDVEEEDTAQEVTAGTKKMKLSAAHGGLERVAGHDESAPSAPAVSANDFPADFFSDPSRAPPPPSDDEDEDDAEAAAPPPDAQASAPATGGAIDQEWAAFEQEVLSKSDNRETFERATVFAEPELAPEVPEGFPPLQTEETGEAETEPELTEDQLRRRKEQDERELIMDRLLEEERLQEEADAKVTILKRRLDLLRKQREAKKAARTSKKAGS